MNSPELVAELPHPAVLLERCRSLAVLDAIFAGRERTYAFDPAWGDGVALASMDNGGGDLYAVVFDPAGVFLYGFDHECDATPWREDDRVHWPGLLDGLPPALARYAAEPAFQLDGFFDATVCAWRETGDDAWRCGPVVFEDGESDGADFLFEQLLDADGTAYADWAEDIFERPVDRAAVAAVFSGAALTPELVHQLNPEADYEEIAREAAALGRRIP
ncbi:hypothetical protein ABZ951_20290 [Streptomyces sp. NPDC046215]